MDGSVVSLAPVLKRRSLRRALQLEIDVVSELWDGAVPLLATNVSLHGLWLESDLPLDVGADLALSFKPPHWPRVEPLWARARVARVGLSRRRNDPSPAGMGVCFVDLFGEQRELLAELLRGLPPPLPARPRVGASQSWLPVELTRRTSLMSAILRTARLAQ